MLKGLMCLCGVSFMMGSWGEALLVMGGLGLVLLMKSGDLSELGLSMNMELDSVGLVLMLLSVWVLGLSLLGSPKVKNISKFSSWFLVVVVVLLIFLILSFSFSDLVLFYLAFESCLIPILVLILGWGYQSERVEAGIYMLFYTLFGSFPLFYMVLSMSSEGHSAMHVVGLTSSFSLLSGLFMISAFLVKFPMYSAHLWLLKAHVEAPVAGSMILAGVLLKLGGYGLVRVLPLFSVNTGLSEIVISLGLWGGLVVSISCLRQMDMKLLVASSSIVHMSGCIGGLFVLSEMGFKGSVGLMVAHGLCSSGLFYLVNLVYERTSSRSMLISKGLLNLMPSMSLWWFLLVSVNMAAPPSVNLLSEILLILSLVSWSFWSLVGLSGMAFFSAAYSLYLFSLSQHGVFVSTKAGLSSGKIIEFSVALFHWLPLNLLILSFFYIV